VAAERTLAAVGRDPGRLDLMVTASGTGRCEVVVHRATYRVPTITVPFLGSWGHGVAVTATHRDVIDPFASGLEGDGDCAP